MKKRLMLSAMLIVTLMVMSSLTSAQEVEVKIGEEFKLSLFDVLTAGYTSISRPFQFEATGRKYDMSCDIHLDGTVKVVGFFEDPSLPRKRATVALMQYIHPAVRPTNREPLLGHVFPKWCSENKHFYPIHFLTSLEELERIKKRIADGKTVDNEIKKLLTK
ncbi:MAG TPA: hypothetical protein VJH33_01325 [Candidatus Paceibacterota bacterium]